MAAQELRLLEDDVPPDPDARPLALFDLDGTLTDPADGIVHVTAGPSSRSATRSTLRSIRRR